MQGCFLSGIITFDQSRPSIKWTDLQSTVIRLGVLMEIQDLVRCSQNTVKRFSFANSRFDVGSFAWFDGPFILESQRSRHPDLTGSDVRKWGNEPPLTPFISTIHFWCLHYNSVLNLMYSEITLPKASVMWNSDTSHSISLIIGWRFIHWFS